MKFLNFKTYCSFLPNIPYNKLFSLPSSKAKNRHKILFPVNRFKKGHMATLREIKWMDNSAWDSLRFSFSSEKTIKSSKFFKFDTFNNYTKLS